MRLLCVMGWLMLSSIYCVAQPFVAGTTYFGTNNYTEYFVGSAPVIISVPHGGYTEPAGMPDRNCNGCAYVRDAYTQELARLFKDRFYERTGCYPHMVYNLLHRKKLDLNRDLPEATDSNAALDVYWYDYHRYIDSAKAHITREYGKGLFIDLHGHGHTKQRIELGYLLTGNTLRLTDADIDLPTYTNYTSVRKLATTNLGGLSHSALIRGAHSMGTLLEGQGYPSVPSGPDPYPLVGDEYFNGGYNTVRHGSNTEGTVDAIQFELYSSIRFDTTERKKFADSLVTAVITYLDEHYFASYSAEPCGHLPAQIGAAAHEVGAHVVLYPNPATGSVNILSSATVTRIDLMDLTGSVVQTVQDNHVQSIDVAGLPSGSYWARITGKDFGVILRLILP